MICIFHWVISIDFSAANYIAFVLPGKILVILSAVLLPIKTPVASAVF